MEITCHGSIMAIEAICTQHTTALYPMGAIGLNETKAFRSVCASSQYMIYMLKASTLSYPINIIYLAVSHLGPLLLQTPLLHMRPPGLHYRWRCPLSMDHQSK